MRSLPLFVLGFGLVLSIKPSGIALAARTPTRTPTQNLAERLGILRGQVFSLEQSLLDGAHHVKTARVQLKKIKKLVQLQKEEKKLGEERLKELESTVRALEERKSILNKGLLAEQARVHRLLRTIETSQNLIALQTNGEINEKTEAPRRKVMANLVDHSLKEIHSYKTDLRDSIELEGKIQEEKEQLAYLFQDLREQASVLELNRQLQSDYVKRRSQERISQLENYRKLKTAEAQVEGLIHQFNTRKELQQKAREAEVQIPRSMLNSEFGRMKGKLPFPVASYRLVGGFGRSFDQKSGLYVFKKGVDLSTDFGETVKAIANGRVAYSGQLPNYGQVVIVDHGDHYYSLYGHLGRTIKKSNDSVQRGESLGLTGDSSTPLYFEIRARNVAVNPLQWLFN